MKRWLSIFVTLLFVLAAGYLLNRATVDNTTVQHGEVAKKASLIAYDVQHQKLTEWVYSRSDRISRETAKVIAREAIETGKPLLILAMIEVESNFTPTAVSSKGAIGLSQIMDVHIKDLSKAGIIKEKRDLFNASQSIRACNFILNDMLKRTDGNVVKALNLYLGGGDVGYKARILGNLGDLYILTLAVVVETK